MLGIFHRPRRPFYHPMKIILALSFAVLVLGTFSGCSTTDDDATVTQTTVEETTSQAATPTSTTTQTVRTY